MSNLIMKKATSIFRLNYLNHTEMIANKTNNIKPKNIKTPTNWSKLHK